MGNTGNKDSVKCMGNTGNKDSVKRLVKTDSNNSAERIDSTGSTENGNVGMDMGNARKTAVIYMDHAATTKIRPEVLKEMTPYLNENYGNPSSIYGLGVLSRQAIEKSRAQVAETIGASGDEIFFTAGGSESDNWALKILANQERRNCRHIITSKIEHHAIINTCRYLETIGYEVTYLDVDEKGMISPARLKSAIRPDTAMISIMFANNEIGTIEPIEEIGNIAKRHRILFHTDAVQAFGQIPIDVRKLNIDMLSASGHKFCGPKGIGFLYVRDGLQRGSLIHGGGQERGYRAGTENVPGIVGIGRAAEIAVNNISDVAAKETKLRDYMISRILHEIPYTKLNGHETKRLPNNINISFRFINGESLLVMLDMAGICCSSGSACSSGSDKPSHVLVALGLPQDLARGAIRFTLGHENTREEIDFVVDKLKENVTKLREMSDDYVAFEKRMEQYKKFISSIYKN